MVSIECRDCGREEHFHDIEDAKVQGWEYDEYSWTCPFCKTDKLFSSKDEDDEDDEDEDTGGDSLLPSFGGGSFGGGGGAF